MSHDEVWIATSLERAKAVRAEHYDRDGRCHGCSEVWPCAPSLRMDETIRSLGVEPPRLAS